MRYSDILEKLQNLINFKPTQQQIADIIGVKQNSIAGRASRNSNFTPEEIEKIESFYGIVGMLNGNNFNDGVQIDYINTQELDNNDIIPIILGNKLIHSVLKVNDAKNLKVFKACGDSMETIIEDGDLLLIDTNRTDFENGGIFLLNINKKWAVKRLRKCLNGDLELICDNAKYPAEILKSEDNIKITIKGRVIKNLSRGL